MTALDLVGITEIAAMLGVSKQRADQLSKTRGSFPPPAATISAGRVWLRADVQEWARCEGRPEGG